MTGLTPLRTLVNIGSGMADLILLPIDQYQRDGRILRGIQKGAKKFVQTAAMETIKLGTKLAVGTQILLEHADAVLSPVDGSSARRRRRLTQNSKYAETPGNITEGVELAYQSLSENIGEAVQTIVAVPMEVYEQNELGETSSIPVVRAVPVAILRPLIGASEAVRDTLLGLRHSINPMARQQMEDKYKPSGRRK